MAKVFAEFSFDQERLDLNVIYTYAYNSFLETDYYAEFNNNTYRDIFAVEWSTGAADVVSVFGGTGFKGSDAKVTGGTATGYLELAWNGFGYDELFAIEKMSVSAEDLYDAVRSSSRSDDQAILREVLSGDDRIQLSDQKDVANGLGGDDKIYGNAGADVLSGGSGFDRLYGGKGDDTLKGGSGSDRLIGDGGKDRLLGGNGDDTLTGDDGADRFIGGTGGDRLFAGDDGSKDVFIYRSLNESKRGSSTRDEIRQFDGGEDKVDLRGLDGDADHKGNQDLLFSKTGAAENAVWTVEKGDDLMLRADVTGDGRYDFEIQLADLDSFGKGDLLL